jgi:hypothetical protein
MTKKSKTEPASQEKEREAANAAETARWEKEKAARQTNAEKQQRYRDSMKAQGHKARLVWEKPLEAGWVKAAAPVIRESSLHIAESNPSMAKVLEQLSGTFIFECKKQEIPEEAWNPVYRDFLTLLRPLTGE